MLNAICGIFGGDVGVCVWLPPLDDMMKTFMCEQVIGVNIEGRIEVQDGHWVKLKRGGEKSNIKEDSHSFARDFMTIL